MGGNSGFRGYIREHLSLYLFVSVLFVTGVVFGTLMVNALSLEQQQDLVHYVNGYFSSVAQTGEGYSPFSLSEAFNTQLKWIALIWVLGLSVVGLPLVLILDFLKGVLVGFSVAFFAGHLSWKGILFALAAIVPQNLVIIPALMILSVSAISFSLYILKNRLYARKGSVSNMLATYTLIAVTMLAAVFGAALLETYVSPSLLKAITPMMLQRQGV